MRKPAVVILLVAGLLLTAVPAAVTAEGVSRSNDAATSLLPFATSSLPSSAESLPGSESVENLAGFVASDAIFPWGVPVFHRRATHAGDAYRSRAPAVIRGLSPPGSRAILRHRS